MYFYSGMPTTKTIAQLYLEHERRFSKQLKRAKSLKEEDLHKLRVEIKNLRVLFEFLQYLDEKNLKLQAVLRLLNPVFKKAGHIRSLQLNLKLSSPYRSATMERFREFLQKQKNKSKARFTKELKALDKEKLKALRKKNLKTLEKAEFKKLSQKSEAFVRSIFAKVRTALFNSNKDEALHEIRTYFKTIKNMAHLLAEFKLTPPFSKEIKNIEILYEKIGQWHDALDLIESFEAYVLEKEHSEAQKNALALVLQLKRKNERVKTQVIKKLLQELN